MRRQNLWIAILAVTATLGTTATRADLIDDSNVQLKFRNFYLDRQYANTPQNNWGSWSQALTLDVKSGYEDFGGLKLGVDVLAQGAIRLDGRDTNDWVLPYDNANKKQESHYGKLGATLKAKVSETELKVGEILPVSPVLVFDPSRQLLTTYRGAWLESKDVKDTKLTLAYIDRINPRYENQFSELSLFSPGMTTLPNGNKGGYDSGPKADGMYIVGIDHQFTKELGASYWYADVRDIYQQHYVGVNYNTTIGESTKLTSHARYFDNSESGDKLYGPIDNQAISLGAKFNFGMNTIGLGYQQMFGNNAFPTLGGWVPQPYLVNWSVATFTNPKEKSWSVSYNYDFSELGAKGLNATAVYFSGTDAEIAGKKQDENELNVIVNYTVPEGKLKGLGIQGMYIDTNYDWKSDLKEYRVATTYTYKF